MLSFVTTWLVWLANPVAFRVVPLHWNALYAYLSIVSTAGNFTGSAFQTMPPI